MSFYRAFLILAGQTYFGQKSPDYFQIKKLLDIKILLIIITHDSVDSDYDAYIFDTFESNQLARNLICKVQSLVFSY